MTTASFQWKTATLRVLWTAVTKLCGTDSSQLLPAATRHVSTYDMSQDERAYGKVIRIPPMYCIAPENNTELKTENSGKLKGIVICRSPRLCSTAWPRYQEIILDKHKISVGSAFPSLPQGTLRLYSMRFCPYAQRTRLVLEHKKIPYETVNVNLKYKPDWFLERNPLGLVPVLEKDGMVVYESVVCDDFLEEMYPDKPLRPKDPYLQARDRILEEIFSKVTTGFFRMFRTAGSDEKAGHKYLKALQIYEEALGRRGNYFGGSGPSMVDFTIWPWIERTDALAMVAPAYNISRDRFPNLYAWKQRMFTLPEVKSTMFDSETHIAFFQSLYSGNPQYDIGLVQAQSNL